MPRTRRRRSKNAPSSGWKLAGAGLAGVALLWAGKRLFSGAPPPQPFELPPPVPVPALPGPPPGASAASSVMHGLSRDRNGLLTVPLPEESAARSRSVRLSGGAPPPPPPARSQQTDEGADRDLDQGDSADGDEGGGRLGGEKF